MFIFLYRCMFILTWLLMRLDLLLLQLYKVLFRLYGTHRNLVKVVGGLPNTAAWIQSNADWFNKGKVYFGTRQCTFLSYEYSYNISQYRLGLLFQPHTVFVFALLKWLYKSKNVKLSKAMPGSQNWTKFINPVTFSNYRAMWLAVMRDPTSLYLHGN